MARSSLKHDIPTPHGRGAAKLHHLKSTPKSFKRPTLNPGTKKKIQERIKTNCNTHKQTEEPSSDVHTEVPSSSDTLLTDIMLPHDDNDCSDDAGNDISSDVMDAEDLCDDVSVSASLDGDLMDISAENDLTESNKNSNSRSQLTMNLNHPISKATIITW